MLLSILMVPSDISLCFVAISVFQQPQADSQLKKAAIERVIVSLLTAALTLAEFVLPQRNDISAKASIGTVLPDEE